MRSLQQGSTEHCQQQHRERRTRMGSCARPRGARAGSGPHTGEAHAHAAASWHGSSRGLGACGRGGWGPGRSSGGRGELEHGRVCTHGNESEKRSVSGLVRVDLCWWIHQQPLESGDWWGHRQNRALVRNLAMARPPRVGRAAELRHHRVRAERRFAGCAPKLPSCGTSCQSIQAEGTLTAGTGVGEGCLHSGFVAHAAERAGHTSERWGGWVALAD